MPNEIKNISIEIRSEEVQEIISHVPNGLVRWGLTVIFFVMVSLLTVTWFIKYPDLLTAKVTITTSPAPVALVARTSGKITLAKNDNELCNTGDIVAYLQSNADLESVLELEDKLNIGEAISSNETLGDLQPYYTTLLNVQNDTKLFTEQAAYEKQIEQLNRQIETYNKLGSTLVKQHKLSCLERQLAYHKFKTDSLLYSQQVIATLDFNLAKSVWLQQQRTSSNIETALYNNELQINQLLKQISDLELQQIGQQQKLNLATGTAQQELLNQIKRWKETFLITSPSVGSLAYLGFLENNNFVEAGRPLFSLIPQGGKLTARAELPVAGSGKVKAGQSVNIRLENYPYEQYGLLHGTITSISEIPSEQKYFLTIDLPQQLITSQKKIIQFKQQLSGTTEIITEDLRLLERFVYQLRKLISTRR